MSFMSYIRYVGGSYHGLHTGDCPQSRTVTTKYGRVVGRRMIHEGERQVDAFQGIPFAKPPVGELRFKKPVPPEPWTVVKETKKFAARGIQKDMTFFEKWKLGPSSEDCLYLNVFTPVWDPPEGEKFPVLVYVHGGAFVYDSAVKYGDIGICKHLVTKGIVVVTIQYRLGFLGFFTTGTSDCHGNFALWDMTMALQWVQDNIALFNGDPNNVSLMGQSAGGACVDLLSLSPHSRDLFHKVLPIAGNACCEWAMHPDAEATCRRFAEKLGVHSHHDIPKYLEDLRKVDAHRFGVNFMVSTVQGAEQTCPIGPCFDGDFFPKSIRELRKEAPPKPRIVGCCRSEGLLFAAGSEPSTVSMIEDAVSMLIKERRHANFAQLREEVLKGLLPDCTTKDRDVLERALVELRGDATFAIGTQKLVLECAEQNAPVYFYSFDFSNPNSWGPLGSKMPFKDATHCTEIAYLFGVSIIWEFDYTAEDFRVLDIASTLWANFIKYGNPNGQDGKRDPILQQLEVPPWEPATFDNPQRHLSIMGSPQMHDVYKNGRPLFFAQLRQKEESSGHQQ